MIVAKLNRIVWNSRRMKRAEDRLTIRGLFKASAFVRTTAKRLIRKRKKQSSPGSPPSTHTGKLRRSILFDVDRNRQESIIGPSADIVGDSGKAHEFGGQYKGGHFEQRAFMGPALEKSSDRLAGFFADEYR